MPDFYACRFFYLTKKYSITFYKYFHIFTQEENYKLKNKFRAFRFLLQLWNTHCSNETSFSGKDAGELGVYDRIGIII